MVTLFIVLVSISFLFSFSHTYAELFKDPTGKMITEYEKMQRYNYCIDMIAVGIITPESTIGGIGYDLIGSDLYCELFINTLTGLDAIKEFAFLDRIIGEYKGEERYYDFFKKQNKTIKAIQ